MRFVKSQITKRILVYGDKSNIQRATILTMSESQKLPTVMYNKNTTTHNDPYVGFDLKNDSHTDTKHDCFNVTTNDSLDQKPV